MSTKKEIGRYVMGDMSLSYWENENNAVGMLLVPLSAEEKVVQKNCALEPLVQLHVRGDKRHSAFPLSAAWRIAPPSTRCA